MQAFMTVFSRRAVSGATVACGATIDGMEQQARIASGIAKRFMLAVVGAGIGSLAGLLISFLGAGNLALIAGAIAGAIIPLVVLGPPGR
jgi:uncharacterized protein YacL